MSETMRIAYCIENFNMKIGKKGSLGRLAVDLKVILKFISSIRL